MATKVTFNSMLKKYMPYDLLKEEIIKRDYFLQKVEKDQNWKGGDMEVAFKGGAARSFKHGGLVSLSKITENKYAKGSVPKYKEIWGAMIFNDSDLQSHGDMTQSFIKILPETLEEFISDMKEAVSVSLLNGSAIDAYDDTSLANDFVNGVVAVKRAERFTIGQYVELGIIGTIRGAGRYVKSIDMENKTVTLSATIDLVATVDVSLDGIVAGDSFYYEGGTVAADKFTSLSEQLLSLANGGTANIFGIPKLSYPHLQAQQFDATARGMSSANILGKLFDMITETRTIGKGNPIEILMSGKNFAVAVAQLQDPGNYGFRSVGEGAKANPYGWQEVTIGGAQGSMKLVGINEMDDDKMYIMDWNALKLHSNGFFERRTSPDGKQFYEVRNDTGANTGYQYVVDIRFFGELIVSKPSHCGVVYNVPAM